jgi:hypothetical protein
MGLDPKSALLRLLAYCKASDWAGYDPYDALNSIWFKSSPFWNSKIARLVLTQTLKRSPINFRGLLKVPKTQNPKGLALFLSATLRAPELSTPETGDLAASLAKGILALRSPDTPYWCWGYSFPWQGRSVLVPRGAPNLVCTTFVAEALLDLYEQRHEPEHLNVALSAAEYLLNDLYWSDGGAMGFAYPLPTIRNQVHNANLLAAALFCRVHKLTGDERFLGKGLAVARSSASKQRSDGSWTYGEGRPQQWIDNFHTGYNLGALKSISRNAGTSEFEPCIRRGFEFYRSHFFLEDGAVRYFHNRTHPLDIHCVAQSIITLVEFADLDPGNLPLADCVFRWAMTHMWDQQGYFYYRVLRIGTVKTPYMRWSEAWMFLALTELARSQKAPAKEADAHDTARTVAAC